MRSTSEYPFRTRRTQRKPGEINVREVMEFVISVVRLQLVTTKHLIADHLVSLFSSASSFFLCASALGGVGRDLERARQVEHVLGDVGQDEVGRDRGHLIQPRLAKFALDIVFTRKTEAAMELQAGVRRLP